MEEEEVAERLHQQAKAYDADVASRISGMFDDPGHPSMEISVETISPGDGKSYPKPGGAPRRFSASP
jgi:hypothetical protein